MSLNFEQLKRRLNDLKQNTRKTANKSPKTLNASSVAIELTSGVVAGLIVGLLLGKIFNFKHIWIIICITLGTIAAFKSIWQKFKNEQ